MQFSPETVAAVLREVRAASVTPTQGLYDLRAQVSELAREQGRVAVADRRIRDYYVIGQAASPHPKFCPVPEVMAVHGLSEAFDLMDELVRWALPHQAPATPIVLPNRPQTTRSSLAADGVARLFWGEGGMLANDRGAFYWAELFIHTDPERAARHLAELQAPDRPKFSPGQMKPVDFSAR